MQNILERNDRETLSQKKKRKKEIQLPVIAYVTEKRIWKPLLLFEETNNDENATRSAS